MDRINQIYKNSKFMECCKEIDKFEFNRIFCRHDRSHLLDVARIAVILNMKERYNIKEEYIYAASLLHDIGRHKQYEEGIPHEIASGEISPEILSECGYDREEVALIVGAIKTHRDKRVRDEVSLRGLIYRADKASRNCFWCPATEKCDWKKSKKNLELFI